MAPTAVLRGQVLTVQVPSSEVPAAAAASSYHSAVRVPFRRVVAAGVPCLRHGKEEAEEGPCDDDASGNNSKGGA